jgi:hypothetical protein
MIKVCYGIIILFLVGCSRTFGTHESAKKDSVTQVSDNENSSEEATLMNNPQDVARDTSMLNPWYDEARDSILKSEGAFYQVSISTSQYEGRSDVTWFFDDRYDPRYFRESWSYEGGEGSTEYFIEIGNVVCSQIEENNETEKWCRITGGIRTKWDEDGSTELLPLIYGQNQNEILKQKIDILKSLIMECEIIEETEGSFTLRSEHTIDVGQEVTESVEVHIPKDLYEILKN